MNSGKEGTLNIGTSEKLYEKYDMVALLSLKYLKKLIAICGFDCDFSLHSIFLPSSLKCKVIRRSGQESESDVKTLTMTKELWRKM